MGLREAINQRPKLSGGIILILATIGIWYAWGAMTGDPSVGRQFYTEDDGKTWYADVAGKIVPFQHNGHEVVMAEVFQQGDRKFVAYMRRYTAKALEQLKNNPQSRAATTATGKPDPANIGPLAPRMEYKKPGDPTWHDIEGNVEAMRKYLDLNEYGLNLTQVDP